MAGYREFQTGEVLTAANVNSFLMEQATMTFADAAARDAALAGVLREGLLTYNLDEGRLEVYDGTDWIEPAPEPPAGIGSNVVQTVLTGTFSEAVASGGQSGIVTGLTVTITPTDATSKILVMANIQVGSPVSSCQITLVRDGAVTSFVGDAEGVRNRITSGAAAALATHSSLPVVFIDNPETLSPVTYAVRLSHTSGSTQTLSVNRSNSNPNATSDPRGASSITAIEVRS